MRLEIRRLEELEVFDALRLSVEVLTEVLPEVLVEVLAEVLADVVAGLGYRSGGLDTN